MKVIFEEYGLTASAAIGGIRGLAMAVYYIGQSSPLAAMIEPFLKYLMGG